MTTTWSPEFRCGVKVGLCLPRRIAATPEARRPSTWSVASTTNHSLFRSAAFAVHVFCLLISLLLGFLVNHFHQSQPAGGSRARRLAAVPRSKELSHPHLRPLSTGNFALSAATNHWGEMRPSVWKLATCPSAWAPASVRPAP